jgi:hypothetical protein
MSPPLTEVQLKHMVDRFLSWKLPANFNPDGGISFEPIAGKDGPHPFHREPQGTNLLDATQAAAMVRHMLEGLPVAEKAPRADGKEYPQYAYTGNEPGPGLVGFVNIQETDAGVRFTVRSAGEGVHAAYEIPIGDAIELLDNALTNFAERE